MDDDGGGGWVGGSIGVVDNGRSVVVRREDFVEWIDGVVR